MSTSDATPLLDVANICAAYGQMQVLCGVSLQVMPGQAVSLMGRNGMGKSTTIKTIMGMLPIRSGSICFNGEPLGGQRVYRVARRGIGLVPEGRQIFSTLSVRENLIATARVGKNGGKNHSEHIWTLDAVYDLFPRLREREHHLGSQLSGGEQQMLAIGRALLTNPQLLILDEATEGLAPLVREDIWQVVRRLRQAQQAILIVDKNLHVLRELCDHHVVLERGTTVWQGDCASLAASMDAVSRYLSV